MNTSFNQDPLTNVDSTIETVQRLQCQIQRLEQSVAISEARNRQLMAAMPQIAWIARADGSMVEFNLRWGEYTGLAAAESLYWGFLEAVHNDDRTRFKSSWKAACQTGNCYEVECRLKGKDGVYRWFKAEATPVIAVDGTIQEWVGTYSECDRRESLPQLEQDSNQEAHLSRILETIPDGIILMDREGQILSANASAESILSLTRAEIVSRVYNDPAWKVTKLDGKAFDYDEFPFVRALNTKQAVYGIEQLLQHEDGSRAIISVNAAPLQNESGDVVGVVAAVSDITDRKHSENERDRFFSLALDLICVAGLDGYFKRINPAFGKTLGYSNEELLNQPFTSFVHPEDITATLAEIQKLSTGSPTLYFENRYRSKSGEYKWLAWAAVPIVEEGLIYAVARDMTAAKQMEETLSRREREYKALLEAIPDVIARCDRQMRYVYVNPEVERTTGVPASEFVGKSFAELGAPPELSQLWEETLTKVFETGEEQAIEFQSPTLDGVRIYQSCVVPEFDREGVVQYGLVVSRDITQIKQAEAEIRQLNAQLEQRVIERTAQLEAANREKDELLLREQIARTQAEAAEMRFRELVNGLVDAIVWECDPVTIQFSFVSQSAERILGYPAHRWTTESGFWASLVHPDDRQWVVNFCQEETTQGRDHEFEYRCLGADGQVVWLRDRAYVVRDRDGKVIKLRGLMIDVTERKQVEAEREKAAKALQESEAKFRRLAESNIIGILFWDTLGNITEANDAFLNMIGYTREDLQVGKLDWQAMTPPEYEELDRIALSQMQASGVCTPWEKDYIRKDGNRVSVLIGGALLEGSEQNGVAFIIDITARKAAEATLQTRAEELAEMAGVLAQTNTVLEKRNQELDQFAYVTSHDLKAPLRAISNLAHWIEEDIQEQLNDETRQHLNLLRGRVHRMEGLIDALLKYSRAGRIKMEPKRVNIENLLAEVIDSLAPPPQFNVEVAPGMPEIFTEELPLQQVFSNLIGNAIKHHDRSDGAVKISVCDRHQVYEFAVTDDGPGISPQFHEKIFLIFQTLQPRDKVESTGVGLSLVKRIVESRGGSIRVESAEGEGATFFFTWSKS